MKAALKLVSFLFLMIATIECFNRTVPIKRTNCRFMNTSSRMCCNGVVVEKKGRLNRSMCCGSKSIDLTYEMCCNGVVQRRLGFNSNCCGSQSYDPVTHNCHTGNTIVAGNKIKSNTI